MKQVFKAGLFVLFTTLVVSTKSSADEPILSGVSVDGDPLFDALQPTHVDCLDGLIQLLRDRFEGWGFALLPPRIVMEGSEKGFYHRVEVDRPSTFRSPSLFAAMKNPYLSSFFKDMGFGIEIHDEVLDLENEEFINGRWVVTGYRKVPFYQEIVQIPDRSTLLFRMNRLKHASRIKFGFIPVYAEGAVLSSVDWLGYLADGVFPMSMTGDIFQHDIHDHLLAVLALDIKVSRVFQMKAKFLTSLYASESLPEYMKLRVEDEIKRLAQSFEEGTTRLQFHISKLRRTRWKKSVPPELKTEIRDSLVLILGESLSVEKSVHERIASIANRLKLFSAASEKDLEIRTEIDSVLSEVTNREDFSSYQGQKISAEFVETALNRMLSKLLK